MVLCKFKYVNVRLDIVRSTKSPIFPWQTMVGLKSAYMAKLSFGSYPHMPGGGGENISAPKIHIL